MTMHESFHSTLKFCMRAMDISSDVSGYRGVETARTNLMNSIVSSHQAFEVVPFNKDAARIEIKKLTEYYIALEKAMASHNSDCKASFSIRNSIREISKETFENIMMEHSDELHDDQVEELYDDFYDLTDYAEQAVSLADPVIVAQSIRFFSSLAKFLYK